MAIKVFYEYYMFMSHLKKYPKNSYISWKDLKIETTFYFRVERCCFFLIYLKSLPEK